MSDHRAGGAILGVLLILVIVGGSSALAVRLGVVEYRLARAWTRHAQAAEAARAAALSVAASWHERFTTLAVGDSAAFGGADPTGTAWYHGWVHHLDGPFFLVRAVARTPDGAARASAGLVTRVVAPPLVAALPGACSAPFWVTPAEALVADHIAQLTPWADLELPPESHARRALAGVMLARGDLQLRGARGHGVLLVEGDLDVAGEFAFEGLVLVGGTIWQRGGPFEVRGVLRSGGPSHLDLGARVVTDSCVLVAMAGRLARPIPLSNGRWLSLAD